MAAVQKCRLLAVYMNYCPQKEWAVFPYATAQLQYSDPWHHFVHNCTDKENKLPKTWPYDISSKYIIYF